jgi:hypothetical protein
VADCTVCTRPVADLALACTSCAGRLARALGDVASLTEDLDDAITRQTRTSSGIGVASRSADRPLPWDQNASLAASTLRNTLSTWTRLVAEERGRELPADTMPAMAAVLLGQLEWIRHHPAAAEVVDEITYAVEEARRAVDLTPNSSTFLVGPCPEDDEAGACPGQVRAYIPRQLDREAKMACGACGTAWEPAQWMRAGRRILARRTAEPTYRREGGAA